MSEIDYDAEIIDSRDIIERINELKDIEPEDLTKEEQEELEGLEAVENECEGYGDWEYGEALIHEDHFEDYCKEICEECYDSLADLPCFISNYIDWSSVADDMKADYLEVDIFDTTFYMRA